MTDSNPLLRKKGRFGRFLSNMIATIDVKCYNDFGVVAKGEM
jgi:hypothetical protein